MGAGAGAGVGAQVGARVEGGRGVCQRQVEKRAVMQVQGGSEESDYEFEAGDRISGGAISRWVHILFDIACPQSRSLD